MSVLSHQQDYFTTCQYKAHSLLIEVVAPVHFSVPVLFCIFHPVFFVSQSEGLMDHGVLS